MSVFKLMVFFCVAVLNICKPKKFNLYSTVFLRLQTGSSQIKVYYSQFRRSKPECVGWEERDSRKADLSSSLELYKDGAELQV